MNQTTYVTKIMVIHQAITVFHVFFLVSCQAFPQSINFPGFQKSTSFDTVEPCSGDSSFCGDDESKYPPLNQINGIITKVLSNPEYEAIAIRHILNSPKSDSYEKNIVINPACTSRREQLPNHLRSKNRFGRWKYIVQSKANRDNGATITICEDEGSKCRNDKDSPQGEDSTVCRQVYREERLLAMDENGELSIDTFSLPSACLCHYQQKNLVGFRFADIARFASRAQSFIVCPTEESLQLSKIPPKKNSNRSARFIRSASSRIFFNHPEEEFEQRVHVPTVISELSPCPDGEDICDDVSDYPKFEVVNRLVKSSPDPMVNVSSDLFNSFFSQPCPSNEGIALKKGVLTPGEEPLCYATEKYIYPQRGMNKHGRWRHIVNTDEFQQGVSISTCTKGVQGTSCKYDGEEGIYPEATSCQQQYTLHTMIVIDSETQAATIDVFPINSACICHLEKLSHFI